LEEGREKGQPVFVKQTNKIALSDRGGEDIEMCPMGKEINCEHLNPPSILFYKTHEHL
jgi:hypothetical protein